MKKSSMLFALLAILLFVHSAFATDDPFEKQLSERTKSLTTLDKTLESLINQVPPKNFTKSELDQWRNQTKWLTDTRKKMSTYKTDLIKMKQGETIETHMAQMNMQFLALQEATQMESRKFHTLSNASKARHDIALNAIRNMK